MNYDFDNPCGLDKSECEWLSEFCRKNQIEYVIEFGPGNSTVAMLNGGVKDICSYEEEEQRASALNAEFDERVCVFHYPAKQIPIWFIGHEMSGFDLAFIDGPTTHDSAIPPRLNAALFCFRRANLIAFHDAKRDQQTISIMLDLGMKELARFDSGRGILVLEHHARGAGR